MSPKMTTGVPHKAKKLTVEEAAQQLQEAVARHKIHTGVDSAALFREPSLLDMAEKTITGQRQQDYGDKLQNFTQIAMLWQGVLAAKLQKDARITPEDVSLLMIQVKISRLAKSPDHYDSWLDIAGYAGCANKLQLERIAGAELLGATVDPRTAGL